MNSPLVNNPTLRNRPFRPKTWRVAALIPLALAILIPLSPGGARAGSTDAQTPPHTNRLIGETSPYLLQHAHNPVDWYPWGPEALEKAKRENRPIFLSIGYSACHWCHVMEREDFENERIARLLNDNFVCIKVDREQRPDIDAQYMLSVQMMTGSGGWPLSVFLMPDRTPFFGGAYFPPDEFEKLLTRVVDVYKTHPAQVRDQAERVATALRAFALPTRAGSVPAGVAERAMAELKRRYDPAEGGFAQKPKFPEAPNIAFLLARYRSTGDRSALDMALKTLDRMAAGGIYDQIGGGFHRYSTDAVWRVPHFEKMLYDQALLTLVYLEAYEITHRPRYREVVEETLGFVEREMRDSTGGFYSTLDADSEGEEGKFYLWTPAQIRVALGADAPLFQQTFGVTQEGDIDGKSVLHRASAASTDEIRRLETMRRAVLQERSRRIRPHTDDKVLANWNGLMIAAYARAYRALGNPAYLKAATEASRFVATAMISHRELLHSFRAGRADTAGMLEDYAFTIYGALELYRVNHDARLLVEAQALAKRMIARFGDRQNGGFYSSAAQGDLLTRLKEAHDNATPSGNGIAALALTRLAEFSGDPAWRREARRTVDAFQPLIRQTPSALPTLLLAHELLGAPSTARAEIVTVRTAPLTARRGDTVRATVRIHIASGWHINASRTASPDLIPTALQLAGTQSARLVTVAYPPVRRRSFGFATAPISVYTGDIVLTASIRIPLAMPRGKAVVPLTLRYQPCSDRACRAPTRAAANLILTVK